MLGHVSRIVEDKGFGFIEPEHSNACIFFHFSVVRGGLEAFRTLDEGSRVTFIFSEEEGRTRATNVDIECCSLNQAISSQIFIATPRAKGIREAIRELEELVITPTIREADIQSFFTKHKILLHANEYKDAYPHVAFTQTGGKKLIPDFVLEPHGYEQFCALVELKLPSERVYINTPGRERLRASICKHMAQCREYSAFFDKEENRTRVQESLGFCLYKPLVFLVVGRNEPIDRKAARDIALREQQIVIQTYDFLIWRSKTLAKFYEKSCRAQFSMYN